MNEWKDKRMDGCIDEWMNKWMNEIIYEWMNEWMNEFHPSTKNTLATGSQKVNIWNQYNRDMSGYQPHCTELWRITLSQLAIFNTWCYNTE